MIAKTADLTRYLYIPAKGVTLTITGDTTAGDTISSADALRYLQDAEAKISRILGDVPYVFTRIATAYTADAVAVVTDKINTDDWSASGYLFFSGVNMAYTGVATTGFSGLSSSYSIPASPVGTFIIEGIGDFVVGNDEAKGYESELYRRLELICKEAAYNIWVTRFSADELPKMIDEWKEDVDRTLSRKSCGMGYVRP